MLAAGKRSDGRWVTVVTVAQVTAVILKTNASEFAKLDRGEGWPFALLVACSVEKGKDRGGDRKSSNQFADRRIGQQGKADLGTTVPKFQKVSANKFAEQAGTSRPRVSRFLDAWHKAADQCHLRRAYLRSGGLAARHRTKHPRHVTTCGHDTSAGP